MEEIIYSPADFVAVFNQSTEYAFPKVVIEGELSSFKLSRGKWVYFDIKDETASLRCFGTVFQLPGPLEDGLMVRVSAAPRLHERFGFSLNIQSITPIGAGSLKKAAQLLAAKLQAEGLFAPERKRPLPFYPSKLGLITADGSAAQADFIKIINQRWGGVELIFADALVQGEQAPAQIVEALEILNKLSILPEALVITRGGGSAEDLAAFNDERVVRAIAASRIPTLVAIGHETDESLAELAADARASTPTNAASMVVPDKQAELAALAAKKQAISQALGSRLHSAETELRNARERTYQLAWHFLQSEIERLSGLRRVAAGLDPKAALQRGYTLVRQNGQLIRSVKGIAAGQELGLELADGRINSTVKEVFKND